MSILIYFLLLYLLTDYDKYLPLFDKMGDDDLFLLFNHTI